MTAHKSSRWASIEYSHRLLWFRLLDVIAVPFRTEASIDQETKAWKNTILTTPPNLNIWEFRFKCWAIFVPSILTLWRPAWTPILAMQFGTTLLFCNALSIENHLCQTCGTCYLLQYLVKRTRSCAYALGYRTLTKHWSVNGKVEKYRKQFSNLHWPTAKKNKRKTNKWKIYLQSPSAKKPTRFSQCANFSGAIQTRFCTFPCASVSFASQVCSIF